MSSSSSSTSSDEDGEGSSSTNPFKYYRNLFIQQQQQPPPQIRQKRRYVDRNREEWADLLVKDYFMEGATYAHKFRRRFRMRREVFDRVVAGVLEHDNFFVRRQDATGRWGLTTLQKCTAAIRMLAYGCSADSVDEYLRMGESTALACLDHFCDAVVNVFGPEYMRRANEEDMRKILAINSARGFPGMMGSIDCMHWVWKNCPKAWHGMFQGRCGSPTLVLEAVATQDTWIWHSFFGVSGKMNDLHIVQRSPVFDEFLNGVAPQVEFEVNGHMYTMPYYLTDGIYPAWATFISGIGYPTCFKERKFTQRQESCRKDVERAFGILQARFAIVKNPALAHNKSTLCKIMDCCITLHNMIVEDERHTYLNSEAEIEAVRLEFVDDTNAEVPEFLRGIRVTRRQSTINSIEGYLRNERLMHSFIKNQELRHDLMEHIANMPF